MWYIFCTTNSEQILQHIIIMRMRLRPLTYAPTTSDLCVYDLWSPCEVTDLMCWFLLSWLLSMVCGNLAHIYVFYPNHIAIHALHSAVNPYIRRICERKAYALLAYSMIVCYIVRVHSTTDTIIRSCDEWMTGTPKQGRTTPSFYNTTLAPNNDSEMEAKPRQRMEPVIDQGVLGRPSSSQVAHVLPLLILHHEYTEILSHNVSTLSFY